jgi:hypothetical protein
MSVQQKYTICILLFLTGMNIISAQIIEHHGQAAAWATLNYSGGTGFQPGARYIPQVLLNKPINDKLKLEGELSADGYLSYTLLPDSTPGFSASASLYRTWLRLSGSRFEIRAGLQKINFGSALMLRPLMWFDRLDPRDPLQLTKGVYGILGKYYFENNANIWLWGLYGNKETKGFETVPSVATIPEFGTRFQLPFPRGEMAFTYHHRTAQFPDSWQVPPADADPFPENRYGFDIKADLGVGIWFEGTVIHQMQNYQPQFQSAMTIGLDYTLGIGEGLNVSVEQFTIKNSEDLLSAGTTGTFTGLSSGIPLSIITRVSAIIFYDWKNGEFYTFGNISFTWDKLAVNIIGFRNPRYIGLFGYEASQNLFSGYGGQVMVVYNY